MRETAATHGEDQLIAMIGYEDVDFQLQETQNRDPEIVELRKRMETEEMDEYWLEDGLVFRRTENDDKLLYVPAEMQDNIIRTTQKKIEHQGIDKCCDRIRTHYWFPRMKAKVQKFIGSCVKCILYSAPVRTSERNLYNIPKRPIPFDTLHLDHFGPLPSLTSKRKHILVIVDAFPKFVKLFAVTSTSTREVNAALEKYFAYYSRPRRIITDRSTCFTSLEFTEFLSKRNVSHVKVATASPQANGQVERVNRVLKTMLGKLSEPMNHADWSSKLLLVEHAINNSVHSTTKQTPSKLLFGIEQRGEIIDKLTEYLDARVESNVELKQRRAAALEAIESSQKYNDERAALK